MTETDRDRPIHEEVREDEKSHVTDQAEMLTCSHMYKVIRPLLCDVN